MKLPNEIPDQIQKEIVLRAPIDRVWRAITNADEFGRWFGAEFDGPFQAGTRVNGRVRPTQVDAAIAKAQAPHDGVPFVIAIERMESPHAFAFRWIPGSQPEVMKGVTTLVVFELTAVENSTRLRITESGFTQISLDRRAAAFTDNEGGWDAQCVLIAKYLDRDAA